MAKESVRVTMRLTGAELTQVREVQSLLSLNAEVDAVRYLMLRGLESLATQLGARRLMDRAEGQWSPGEMLPLLQAMIEGKPPTLKPVEKIS